MRSIAHMKRTLNSLLLLVSILCCLSPLWLPSSAAPAPALPRIDRVEHRSYLERVPGTGITFEMIAIPGGAYLMGSPPGEKGRRDDEGPQHPVAVRPFWMCKTEVTWDLFDAYRAECGVRNLEAGNLDPGDNEKRLAKDPDAVTGPTHPYVEET